MTTTPETIDPIDPQIEVKQTAELQARELAKKNKELTTKLEAFEAQKIEAENKKLEEQGNYKALLDKANQENTDLKNKSNIKDRNSRVETELKKAGINPDLIDYVTPEFTKKIEFDSNNQPTNLEAVMSELVTSKPSLFVKAQSVQAGNVGVANTTSSTSGMSFEKANQILSRNNYDEISKYQADIAQALTTQ